MSVALEAGLRALPRREEEGARRRTAAAVAGRFRRGSRPAVRPVHLLGLSLTQLDGAVRFANFC
jgi:hypothetical protein